jgi:hypothetical protein
VESVQVVRFRIAHRASLPDGASYDPSAIGTWGTGIFGHDVALDVRNVWIDAMDAGLSQQQATAQVIEGVGADFIEDADDGPVFWLVLASLQLEVRALDTDVAQRARPRSR